jgi:hypothetical protein
MARPWKSSGPSVRGSAACFHERIKKLLGCQFLMNAPSPGIRDLAKRLLGASQAAGGGHMGQALAVSERLRVLLTRFAGPDGFTSLLKRALALAGQEVPLLRGLKVSQAGCLEGLEQAAGDAGERAGVEGAVAITAHLLGLLVTFIGEPLTLALVHEAWPNLPREGTQSNPETV